VLFPHHEDSNDAHQGKGENYKAGSVFFHQKMEAGMPALSIGTS
jgi:hypothetical protein